ncbi:hypothetical protein BGZ91_008494, partial [Linnemannia elongata]
MNGTDVFLETGWLKVVLSTLPPSSGTLATLEELTDSRLVKVQVGFSTIRRL